MLKSVCLVTIVVIGVTLWTVQADDAAKESQCIKEIEDELQKYVKLDVWQQLFRRHYKFVVNDNGKVKNGRNRTKSNTMIHDALYGKCDEDRDDEVDDCPNIHRGVIKSCERAINLRAAVFRTARCAFVESSVKQLVLGDAMVDTLPPKKLDNILREFGPTVVSMLRVLAHGETSGMAELMAVNLYLNNKYDAVFTYKIPAVPATSLRTFVDAKAHMRDVHQKILQELYAFWDTWCGDRDVIKQYRMKYEDIDDFDVLAVEMRKNVDNTDDLIRELNVTKSAVDLDFDPKVVALDDYINRLTERQALPVELLDDIRFRSFEVSYAFDPRAMYEHHKYVFRQIYMCFYWTTVAHLRLADMYLEKVENLAVPRTPTFAINFINYVRPLAVFYFNQFRFVPQLSPEAAHNVVRLYDFLMRLYRDMRKDSSLIGNDDAALTTLRSWRPEIQEFVNVLNADMKTMSGLKPLPDYLDDVSADEALKFMRTNYQAFVRLVSATSSCKRDRENLIKLKKFFFYLTEAVPFDLQ